MSMVQNRSMLIARERLYHAVRLAGLTRLPVLVREGEGVRRAASAARGDGNDGRI